LYIPDFVRVTSYEELLAGEGRRDLRGVVLARGGEPVLLHFGQCRRRTGLVERVTTFEYRRDNRVLGPTSADSEKHRFCATGDASLVFVFAITQVTRLLQKAA